MISSGRPQWAQRRQMDRGPTNAYTAAETAKSDEQDFQCRRYSDSTEHPMQPMEGPPSRRGLADGRNGYHGEQRGGLGKCSKEKPLGAKNKLVHMAAATVGVRPFADKVDYPGTN
ncbi:hypothetical protein SCAR479_11846 [Seiridium cardinale]|uniref:Uncharacterized protein n=1 Tax=Seiridium cardinale TaxID=138064 RepID=A0ABR2XCL6_9PEZI